MEILFDKGIRVKVEGNNISIEKEKEYKNRIFFNYKNGNFDLQIDNKTFKNFSFIKNEYEIIDIIHPSIQLSQELKKFCFSEAIRIKREIVNFDDFNIGLTALQVYNSIFNETGELPISSFKVSGLRYYIDKNNVTYCEQNPNKDSKLGQKARDGEKIINVYKKGQYILRVENGEII